MSSGYAYGLWILVVVNSAIFIIFALSFFHPASKRDWRALGVFSAFIVALFTEMYGFPLTIYLFSGWLGSKFPGLDLTHGSGHLWNDLIGWTGDPHLSPFHIASYIFIGGGFWLITSAWSVLFRAQKERRLAITGAYARVRHPQYAGFLLVMVGFLLQWPTLPTLLMFPVLVYIYRRLAIAEEREVRATFGAQWDAYAALIPRFVPHRRRTPANGSLGEARSGSTVASEASVPAEFPITDSTPDPEFVHRLWRRVAEEERVAHPTKRGEHVHAGGRDHPKEQQP